MKEKAKVKYLVQQYDQGNRGFIPIGEFNLRQEAIDCLKYHIKWCPSNTYQIVKQLVRTLEVIKQEEV